MKLKKEEEGGGGRKEGKKEGKKERKKQTNKQPFSFMSFPAIIEIILNHMTLPVQM
jgi:hypothetical protein